VNNSYTAGVLLLNIGMQVILPGMAFAVVVGRVNPIQWLGLRWKGWVQVFGIAPLAVFLMFGFSIILHYVGYTEMLIAIGAADEQAAVTMFREGDDPVALGLMVLAAVIVAPVCEEIIFRGYLYPVAKKYAGSTVAALFSALVFAGAHGNVAAMLPLFVFGLVLVAVYEHTGSIWAPISVHLLFNGTTVAIQFLVRIYGLPEGVGQ
jgi:membrane protease YdiL (CAAX protease family)